MKNVVMGAAVFLVLWLFASVIWSFWLDGIMNPIAGLITAGVFFGATTFKFSSGL